MFGEEVSESPRQPSPWEAISSATTPEMRPSYRRSSSSLSRSLQSSSNLSRSLQSDSSIELLKLDSRSVSLSPEVDSVGHIEYKLKLVAMTPDRMQKLVTQLKWRLMEGGGQCYYEIGVRDDGAILGLVADELDESLATLDRMATVLGAQCEGVREIMLMEEDPSEDGDEPGPAPDNPLLARPRQRCVATPSLDPTPELSDSETSVTSALGELARMQVTESDDDKLHLPTSSAKLVDVLPPAAIEPGPELPTVYSPAQIARRRKKTMRRQASRLRRAMVAQGIEDPTPIRPSLPVKVKPVKAKLSKRPPKPAETDGVRYAAEVLITLGVNSPSYLSFETPFGFEGLTDELL